MEFETAGAPHTPAANTVSAVMRQVLYALVPAVGAHIWFFGFGIVFQLLIASTFALGFEAIALKLRRRPLKLFLLDGSALVTAVLFVLCLPPLIPWWVNAIGMFFAIVVAKHLYGGLGFNIFNPAMVGYVAVLISFPAQATQWLPPLSIADHGLGIAGYAQAIFGGTLPALQAWDGITQATPLDVVKTQTGLGQMIGEIRSSPLFGDFGGAGWEWIANMYLLGGLWLLYQKIIDWRVPAAMIGTLLVCSTPFFLLDPDTHPQPLHHVFSGGLVLGAFFIATDPVSGSTTPRGRLVFGIGVGLLTLIIRRWGGYPDGVAFGVLIMNLAVPLIDQYTKPRVFGSGLK